MLEFLKSIPDSIWAVAVGSIIAFVGVLISNKNQIKQLEIQLNHEKELKSIERKYVLRREVYLNAAEELVRANTYLGSLPQVDPVKTNIGSGLQDFFVATAKLGLVAEQETGIELNKLVMAYSGLIFKLMAKVTPVNEEKNKIENINKYYDESQEEIKRVLAEMTRYNESGNTDSNIFEALNRSFEFQQKRSKELTDERDECWDKANKGTKEFAQYLMEEMKEIADLQTPVMVAIRKELEIDTNIIGYKEIIDGNANQIKEQLDEFLNSMN